MSLSKKLHASLKRRARPEITLAGMLHRPDAPRLEAFLQDGFDPLHAAYAFTQHLTSIFAEIVSSSPVMRPFNALVGKAEDLYLPEGPPISPVTRSAFLTWALYDLRLEGEETLAACMLAANDVIGLTADQLVALRNLSDSRMGIYEAVRLEDRGVRLRELMTDRETVVWSASGYRGRPGKLWLVRVLPPLSPTAGEPSLAITTPYVLQESAESWRQFFRRAMLEHGLRPDADGLHRLLKFGPDPDPYYWHEYVFRAYHGHLANAVFLKGIPDLPGTLPHA